MGKVFLEATLTLNPFVLIFLQSHLRTFGLTIQSYHFDMLVVVKSLHELRGPSTLCKKAFVVF